MRRDEVNEQITQLAFEFFYWFSRFEFALKENDFLEKRKAGSAAMPGWQEFVEERHHAYVASAAALELLQLQPKCQVVASSGSLAWEAVDISKCQSTLGVVVLLLEAVRNNLFHGGKHGVDDWAGEERTAQLLNCGMKVLNELAALNSSLEGDYKGIY